MGAYGGGGAEAWQGTKEHKSQPSIPSEFSLHQNYPNPFNLTTVIPFDLPAAGHVDLTIHDVQGRLVARLVDGWRAAGRHDVTFDASVLASGLYLYQLRAGDFERCAKMILVK